MDGQFVTMGVKRGTEELKPLWDILDHSKVFIAGGYARYCVTADEKPAPVNDVDIFCKDVDAYNKHRQLFVDLNLGIQHENQWSVTFNKNPAWNLPKVQLIKPVSNQDSQLFGDVVTVLSAFDFSISRVAFLTPTVALADKLFQNDDANKTITICLVTNPIKIVRRLVKYSKKGYFVQNWEISKIFRKWDTLDTNQKEKYYSESDYYLPLPVDKEEDVVDTKTEVANTVTNATGSVSAGNDDDDFPF